MVTFSQILLKLQEFWAKQGCNIVQPYDIPAGVGNISSNDTFKKFRFNSLEYSLCCTK